VAEDSEDDYELLVRELQRGGYRLVAERVVSPEALAAALERAWDLIISDWFMPALDGLAVLDALAARRPAAPCIIHSGTTSQEAAVQALRAGALDFLSKDKPRLLVPAVQRVLREAAESRARAAAEQELRLSEERYRKSLVELRTPLDAILGAAALLYEGRIDPGSPEHRELLGDILASGRHLRRLIDEPSR
jgi:two-component system, cell cycle sensor histidine kinase and response regulator CckA